MNVTNSVAQDAGRRTIHYQEALLPPDVRGLLAQSIGAPTQPPPETGLAQGGADYEVGRPV